MEKLRGFSGFFYKIPNKLKNFPVNVGSKTPIPLTTHLAQEENLLASKFEILDQD